MPTPNPNGCRHDGIDQRTHARQWTPNAGWHTWEQPTQEQIKDRMRARRPGPDTKFCILCLSEENRRADGTAFEPLGPSLPIHHICEGDDDGCDLCQPEPDTASS